MAEGKDEVTEDNGEVEDNCNKDEKDKKKEIKGRGT